MNSKSKKYVLSIAVVFIVLSVLFAENSPLIAAKRPPEIDPQEFRDNMRKLWEDHVNLTRFFIISTISNLPDQNETAQRMIQNQNEIGDAIKPFYGDAAGDQLAELLREHVLISATMLQAARKADAPAFEEAVARWYSNADELAELLFELNPENWPLRKTRPIMKVYLDLTLEQALARWNGDFEKDIESYDKVHSHALEIADMLSEGIINRFWERFR